MAAPSQGSSSLSLAAYGGKRGKFAGLRNQGATCYLNSLLQAMYMTPDFKQALQQCTASELPALPHALCRLFSELQTSSYAVSTEPFTSTMQWGSVYKQQDVHEFWTCLCERLESELKSHPMHKLIESLFQGKQRDFVTCRECGRTSHTEDVFQDLKLVVPLETPPLSSSSSTTTAATSTSTATFGPPTAATAATAATSSTAAPAAAAPAAAVAPPATPCVASALAELLKPEEMSGDCQYHCEACARKVDAVRGVELRELPRVLTLQLKRFGYDVRTGQRFKVNTPFPFETMIDMRPFVAAAAGGGGARPSPLLYELYGVLVHAGSANFGHYYAILKDFESSEWFEFNDSRVEPVKESDLRAQFGGGGSSNWSGGSSAYMLLYRQRPGGMAAEAAGAAVGTSMVATGAAAVAAMAAAGAATGAATGGLGSRLGSLTEEAMVDEVPSLATASAATRGDSLAHELKRHCAGQAAADGSGGGCSGGGGGCGGGASAATAASAPLESEAEVRAAAEGGGEACDMETEETEDSGNPYVSMGF